MHPPRLLGHYPISDKLIRERIFMIVGQRDDKKDILLQVAVLMDQLVTERFTGSVSVNFHEGGISEIKAIDKQNAPINGNRNNT